MKIIEPDDCVIPKNLNLLVSTCLVHPRLAKVYTASSQIIKRIILRHLEHPVSILSLFKRNLAKQLFVVKEHHVFRERGVLTIAKDLPLGSCNPLTPRNDQHLISPYNITIH